MPQTDTSCNCSCGASGSIMLPIKLTVDAGLGECPCQEGSQGGAALDYSLEEQFTGAHWIDGKKVYQITVDCGALPNTTSKDVPHNVPNIAHVVRFYGTSNDGDVFASLPNVGTTAGGTPIYTHVDKTNVRFWTANDFSKYNKTFVTIFYTCTDR